MKRRGMSQLLAAGEGPTDLTQRRLSVPGEAALKLPALFACGMRRQLRLCCQGSWVRIRLILFCEFPDQTFAQPNFQRLRGVLSARGPFKQGRSTQLEESASQPHGDGQSWTQSGRFCTLGFSR